jgi:hypothetical protein
MSKPLAENSSFLCPSLTFFFFFFFHPSPPMLQQCMQVSQRFFADGQLEVASIAILGRADSSAELEYAAQGCLMGA